MCVAAQSSTGPSKAMEPRTSKTNLTMGCDWKLRWESMRWMRASSPSLMREYIIASSARSDQEIACSQSKYIAKTVARKGTITPMSTTALKAPGWLREKGSMKSPSRKTHHNRRRKLRPFMAEEECGVPYLGHGLGTSCPNDNFLNT